MLSFLNHFHLASPLLRVHRLIATSAVLLLLLEQLVELALEFLPSWLQLEHLALEVQLLALELAPSLLQFLLGVLENLHLQSSGLGDSDPVDGCSPSAVHGAPPSVERAQSAVEEAADP